MKLMTTWTLRDDLGDADQRIAAGKAIEAFGRWTLPEGVTLQSFVARADGGGGCSISETDDVLALSDAAEKFNAWYKWEIVPVMDLTDDKTIEFLINVVDVQRLKRRHSILAKLRATPAEAGVARLHASTFLDLGCAHDPVFWGRY